MSGHKKEINNMLEVSEIKRKVHYRYFSHKKINSFLRAIDCLWIAHQNKTSVTHG